MPARCPWQPVCPLSPPVRAHTQPSRGDGLSCLTLRHWPPCCPPFLVVTPGLVPCPQLPLLQAQLVERWFPHSLRVSKPGIRCGLRGKERVRQRRTWCPYVLVSGDRFLWARSQTPAGRCWRRRRAGAATRRPCSWAVNSAAAAPERVRRRRRLPLDGEREASAGLRGSRRHPSRPHEPLNHRGEAREPCCSNALLNKMQNTR